tara:strand:- start:2140 stop:3249 length:1110 start_codon:yes stop_codon:yes gene_type:complete
VKNVAIVTTTINVPVFLSDLSKNAVKYNKSNLKFYIVGDKKTPVECIEYCKSLDKDFPYDYEYLGINDQEKKLSNYPELLKIIPYNSGVRKLLGNLIAYLDGADVVIQIDDDNFILSDDFIGSHCKVDTLCEIELFESKNGWFNVYSPLVEENNIPFFPRGFPWSKRDYQNENKINSHNKKAKIVTINGLVYEDPDIDAISRLFWPIRVVDIDKNFLGNYGLYPGTWSSFNNQNTSTSRELTEVFFTPPSGGRNSDIWTSFVICKLVEKFDDVIAYGSPMVKQIRNPHNLWTDLEDELISNKATENFIEILRSVNLNSKTYTSALNELMKKSLMKLESLDDIPSAQYDMMKKYFEEYIIWNNIFIKLNK